MKRSLEVLKKIVMYIFILGILLSPFLYLIKDREYDVSQSFVPQDFSEDGYDVVDVAKSDVIQSFVALEDNLVGFDLGPYGCNIVGDNVKVSILDEDRREIRSAHLSRNLLVNKCAINSFRFKEIKNSSGQIYYVEFTNQSGFSPKLKYSTMDYFDDGELEMDGKIVDGDIDLVPVYRANSYLEYVQIVWERITFFSSP